MAGNILTGLSSLFFFQAITGQFLMNLNPLDQIGQQFMGGIRQEPRQTYDSNLNPLDQIGQQFMGGNHQETEQTYNSNLNTQQAGQQWSYEKRLESEMLHNKQQIAQQWSDEKRREIEMLYKSNLNTEQVAQQWLNRQENEQTFNSNLNTQVPQPRMTKQWQEVEKSGIYNLNTEQGIELWLNAKLQENEMTYNNSLSAEPNIQQLMSNQGRQIDMSQINNLYTEQGIQQWVSGKSKEIKDSHLPLQRKILEMGFMARKMNDSSKILDLVGQMQVGLCPSGMHVAISAAGQVIKCLSQVAAMSVTSQLGVQVNCFRVFTEYITRFIGIGGKMAFCTGDPTCVQNLISESLSYEFQNHKIVDQSLEHVWAIMDVINFAKDQCLNLITGTSSSDACSSSLFSSLSQMFKLPVG